MIETFHTPSEAEGGVDYSRRPPCHSLAAMLCSSAPKASASIVVVFLQSGEGEAFASGVEELPVKP